MEGWRGRTRRGMRKWGKRWRKEEGEEERMRKKEEENEDGKARGRE